MTQEPDREGSALKGSRVQGADRSATGASAAGAVKHWLVLGRDPDDSTFIVWDEQTADDHRETGYRVDGPFVLEKSPKTLSWCGCGDSMPAGRLMCINCEVVRGPRLHPSKCGSSGSAGPLRPEVAPKPEGGHQ